MSRRTASFKGSRTSKRLTVDATGKVEQAKINTDSSDDSDSGSDSELFNLGAKTLARMKAALKVNHSNKKDSTGGFFLDKNPVSEKETVQDTASDEIIPLSQSSSVEQGEQHSSGQGPREKKPEMQLSSSLQVDIDEDVYVHSNMFDDGAQAKQKNLKNNKKIEAQLMQQSVLTGDAEKQHTIPPYSESYNQLKKQRRAEREKTKGKDWFNLPATELTEEKKNDLMVLQYRRALDPKRFYKAPDIRAIPKYFQMGKVVDNPVDFYHSRIPKKQRKKTLVDELLDDQEFRQFNKRKYAEIQESKMKGRRGAFKHMKRLKKKKK